MNSIDEKSSDGDIIPTVQVFEGIGELTVGGSVAAGDSLRLIFTAFAILDNPNVNSYLLANRVKIQDRMTKTRVFPRNGMSLPAGEVYIIPQEEEPELPSANTENEQ